ncbi:uncharacterized protein HD556DRAFT_1445641 [Suillus plorans]|uniref:CxC1-like cysteine cluster associated with KDZ transposases domain-containing protein n=1 Tax=Suillus plorans TaxID=116603 RepID=A0A9P7AK60_9AGAM|nr:uncharacterized protein HD556DRAFT_1445641 [Suillus plorans]KAG1791119.1 hypothetical protein HD556DRAFT_1445641 [Suillus plorans]
MSSISIPQAAEEPANVSLINVGLIGCSPIQPTIAISLKCLELYHQIRRWKPSFSVQAMVKVLCALHNAPLRDQFAIAFDVYLDILRHVQERVNIALKRDSPDWCMLHTCPACDYKQENKSTLLPRRMDSIDGNSSLKWVDGSGHADERIFRSSYLIPASEVDRFKDDVQLRPGTRKVTENSTPADATESVCTDNWKTANTITDNTIKVFEQTSIFISACRHGMVQTIVEMRRSGELAKYALATTNKILDVYRPNGATGYDIGCSYQTTVNASSISAKARSHQHQFIVNSFHGRAHNHRCQLRFHPLYRRGLGLEDLETCERVFSGSNTVAPVIHHASYFHWLQFVDLHFRQWDADRYLELSKFLYNNYKQALAIVNDLTPAVEELKLALKITDVDFEHWNAEELDFLESMAEESDEDVEAMAYVEALESLMRAQAAYGSITTVQFLTYMPADFTLSHERNAAYRKLLVEMNAVDDLERRMAITERWQPDDPKYKEALAYLTNRQFIRVIEQLQGLVVQRLFELAKANIAGTGYKLRQHISSAISRRSAAIRTVLERYNRLAPVQTPPREMLEFSDIASYAWLGEFDLLKHLRHHLLQKPWASKVNREVANHYFKILRAREEIQRLNIEVGRLAAWVDDEDAHLQSSFESLLESDPALSHEICCVYEERKRVNDVHCGRIDAIYELPGYSGLRWVEKRGIDEGDAAEMMADLRGARSIEADEADDLSDEVDRLESCII